ncbi:MAG: hypothetical protein CR971_01050 [candidate division SR1 bacterium]|nr:MAG: hypothetical protein CR971_01050 [candidate division SR1 bacterium]
MRKGGFTLIEMLIVIVIIGILAAAIVPKITGVLARARDTQRVADLRNVAMAVENYKMDYGEYPKLDDCGWTSCGFCTVFGDVKRLQGSVSNYLSQIPSDPQKNSFVKIHNRPLRAEKNNSWNGSLKYWWGEKFKGGHVQTPGQYLYQIFRYKGDNFGSAVLVAKVENPGVANYVLVSPEKLSLSGGSRENAQKNVRTNCWDSTMNKMEELHLCTSVKKVSKGNEVPASATNSECKYSDESQLYYILKV